MFLPLCLTVGMVFFKSYSASKNGGLGWCQWVHFLFHLTTPLSPGRLKMGRISIHEDRAGFQTKDPSVLKMACLVTVVPTGLRPLTRYSWVVVSWSLTTITFMPSGKILHGVSNQGQVSHILYFWNIRIITLSCRFLTRPVADELWLYGKILVNKQMLNQFKTLVSAFVKMNPTKNTNH